MLIDRRYLVYFDWISFFITLSLATVGLLFVFSATYTTEIPFSTFFKKQLLGVSSGIGIYLLFCFINPLVMRRFGYFFFFGVVALLFVTIIKGSIGMGAQRWINIGIFKFQPSELAKLFLPPFITYYLFTTNDFPEYKLKDFIPVIGVIGITFLLILKQPDLGTGILFTLSGATMLWLVGLNKKFFIYTALAITLTAPILIHFLKPYQRKRIEVFLGQGDTHKERYQIEQSKIAIGSGNFIGKGFLNGTQNKLNFLPEGRTDFIFSVVSEELGFLGVFAILMLYLFLFLRCLKMISLVNNFFSQLLALGLLIHILASTLINIGMVIGLLPIVGIPLPLMSYGISHSWITFASLGWINSIVTRRFLTLE